MADIAARQMLTERTTIGIRETFAGRRRGTDPAEFIGGAIGLSRLFNRSLASAT